MDTHGKKMVVDYIPYNETNKRSQMVIHIPTNREFNLLFPDSLLAQQMEKKLMEQQKMQQVQMRETMKSGMIQLKILQNEIMQMQNKILKYRQQEQQQQQQQQQQKQQQELERPEDNVRRSSRSIHYHYHYPIKVSNKEQPRPIQNQKQPQQQPSAPMQETPEQQQATPEQQQEKQQEQQQHQQEKQKEQQQQQQADLQSRYPFATIVPQDILKSALLNGENVTKIKQEIPDSPRSPSPTPSTSGLLQVSPLNLVKKRTHQDEFERFVDFQNKNSMVTRFKLKKLNSLQ